MLLHIGQRLDPNEHRGHVTEGWLSGLLMLCTCPYMSHVLFSYVTHVWLNWSEVTP